VAQEVSGARAASADLASVAGAALRDDEVSPDALRDLGADPTAVLVAWDAARARAYARGRAGALARLYLPGSVAGHRDVRLLADYAARGLRVRGMRMEIARVEVLRDRSQTRLLRVTDRLVGSRAVRTDGTSYPLPRDRPSTRTVRLVHHDGAWRVASVGPAG
ncbi:MAG: hypothetical protein Q8Q02_06670, partial [Nocardioides sp.]|nr:hypothetical protein [Nocardioides sp.]